MAIVELAKIYKNYKTTGTDEDKKIKVLQDINMKVDENELIAIMGRSGSGKTTLLKILGIMHPPSEGNVLFEGEDITEMSKDKLADIRRQKVGFVFQDFWLMDSLTVYENILLPMIIDANISKEEMLLICKKWVAHFEIEHLINKYPHDLSGGERQRVAICRALVNSPRMILADESTGNLDTKSGEIVINALKNINHQFQVAVVIVTHDPKIASQCNKVLFFKGRGDKHDPIKNRDTTRRTSS